MVLLPLLAAHEALAQPPVALPTAQTPQTLPPPPTPTQAETQPWPVDLPPAATPVLIAWPNPSAPPAWIQWLGWAPDGRRLAWRQGPEWAPLLPGSPIEIVRLDERGAVLTNLHQRETPAVALKQRHIRSTEPLPVERKTDRDVLLQTSTGRLLAVVVRPGRTSVAAILEKNRH